MRRFFFILLIGFNQVVFSQVCSPDKGKERRVVDKIERLIETRDFYDALDKLKDLRNYTVYNALKAEIFWLRGDFINAEKQALITVASCPEYFPEVYCLLGEIAFNRKDYINADIYFRKSIELGISDPYYSNAVMLSEKAKVIVDLIKNPVPFDPKVVQGISTEHDEYLAIISPDQEFSFFTRRSLKDSREYLTPTTVEEFIGSQRINEKFHSGIKMPYPFNQESNEGGASITIDNRTLYYTKCVRDNTGYNNCDIYYVNKVKDGWSDVYSFNNSISKNNSWESQPSISSNGKTIIFSSDRSGGFGGMDLYEINFVDGEWTSPINLGPMINSSFNEKSPFLHTDGETLFFSSNNFPSLGGFDIFYSRKDSSGFWNKPVNIGSPINTVSDEISLFVSTDGHNAYFASNKLQGKGGWDIYSFFLHEGAKPKRVLFVKGLLLDEDGEVLEGVEVEFKNLTTQETTIVKVDKGGYVSSLTLDNNDDVLLTVKQEGFAFNSKYISADDTSFAVPVQLDIDMEVLQEGRSFNLENIYFTTNSFKINKIAYQVLLAFADYLTINNNLVIEINGFTDDIGDSFDNQLLSENRARAVYDLILSKGIPRERLSFNGFGEQFPIADNNTVDGRAKNRRTEFKIIKE